MAVSGNTILLKLKFKRIKMKEKVKVAIRVRPMASQDSSATGTILADE